MSVGLGNMAVHVEVPGDLGQGEFSPFKFRRQYDLAAQPGVLLEEGGHVQHVILPGQGGQRLVMGTLVQPARAQKGREGGSLIKSRGAMLLPAPRVGRRAGAALRCCPVDL